MNIDLLIPSLAIFISLFVSAILLNMDRLKNQKLPEESGLLPDYEEIGGGRFDIYNYTFPFVRISLYKQFIVISYKEKLLLKWDDIKSVEIINWLISKGVKIQHSRTDLPELIILWSKNAEKLKRLIKSKL